MPEEEVVVALSLPQDEISALIDEATLEAATMSYGVATTHFRSILSPVTQGAGVTVVF